MNVLRHKDKGVQFISALAAVSIQGLQKQTCVEFDDEQLSAMVCREGHEVSSGRRDESSRLQGGTSAAESRASLRTLNWHEWNSCPSRWFFVAELPFREGRISAVDVSLIPRRGEEVLTDERCS